MPFLSGMSFGKLGNLLPKRSQREDPPFRFEPQTDSVKVAAFVAQIQHISLVKNAKLLVFAQVERPLCRLRISAPMVFVVKEVTIASPLSRHRMKMTGFTTDGHGYILTD